MISDAPSAPTVRSVSEWQASLRSHGLAWEFTDGSRSAGSPTAGRFSGLSSRENRPRGQRLSYTDSGFPHEGQNECDALVGAPQAEQKRAGGRGCAVGTGGW